MSVNNRKYITSTGMLLKQLNEESNNNSNNNNNPMYHQQHHHNLNQQQQQQQQRQLPMYPQQQPGNNYHLQQGMSNFSNQPNYSNMPANYSTGGQNMPNMFTGLFPNGPNGLPVSAALNAAAAALINKLSSNPNQFQSQSNVPDIMMLPGSMSQQRWQKKSKITSSHPYQQLQQQQQQKIKNQPYQQSNKPSTQPTFQQKPLKNQTSNKKSNNSSSSGLSATNAASSSSVTELPETFGLPSNKQITKTNKYASSSSTSLQSNSSSSSSSSTMKNNDDILIEDKIIESAGIISNEQILKSDDIEIISENYPLIDYTTTANTITNANNNNVNNSSSTMMIQAAFQTNNDENFKNYLSKNYNNGGQLAIATKPQSNFMSNFACINQILNECDYYNKLRRRKPYSNVRPNKILYESEEEDEEVNSGDEDAAEKDRTKIKSKKIIVIDDTNEEMHKPWITPDLIKLIKQRNLLQSKINENNIKLDVDSNTNAADAEVLKKFKNLRNKVTKLVKKARKDYLTKYIQESKENKISTGENNKQLNSELDSELINNLAKNPVPPPSTSAAAASAKSPNSSTTIVNSETTTVIKSTTTTHLNTTNLNPAVQTLTSQMNSNTNKSSFLQNQNNLLMSLYNTYFNQYLQQYQHQQQQLAAAASSETDSTKNKEACNESAASYDMLQKQAAYYAQQQRAIQTQLEASLAQSAQQLVQEIAAMASTKVNQPAPAPPPPAFLLNQQYSHQQQQQHQHHLHQHLLQQPQNQPQSGNFTKQQTNQMAILLPPPNQGTGLLASSQTSNIYNMHYDYNNMIVS